MTKRPLRTLMASLAATLMIPLAGTGLAAAQSSSGGQAPPTGRAPATLKNIEVKPGDSTYDRVVFHFADPLVNDRVPDPKVEYLDGHPTEPGSGKPVEMEGQLFLGVTFPNAVTDGSVPRIVDEGLPVVAEVRHLGGFEKVQEAAIGVSSCHGAPVQPSYHVRILDTDIVVDVNTPDCG